MIVRKIFEGTNNECGRTFKDLGRNIEESLGTILNRTNSEYKDAGKMLEETDKSLNSERTGKRILTKVGRIIGSLGGCQKIL